MNPERRERVVVVTGPQAGESEIPGPAAPGGSLSSRLEAAGVRVWAVPVVAYECVPDTAPLDAALARLDSFGWVAFTSARAVEAVCDRPAWRRHDWSLEARPFLCAVGPVTAAALTAKGLPVRLQPDAPGAVGLARAIIGSEAAGVAGRRVLWPRADVARPDLRDRLLAAGAEVVDPVVYRTVPAQPGDLPACLRAIADRQVDAVAFLSPSSAGYLAAAAGEPTLAFLAGRTVVASVGPTTSGALAALGAPPQVEAAERTGGGLAAALLSYLGLNEGMDS